MELQEFISQTLLQIVNAVEDTQEELSSRSLSRVIPLMHSYSEKLDAKIIGIAANEESPVILVDFDIAVVASKGSGKKGGISILSAAIGVQAEAKSSNTNESRVKFAIPITFPWQKYNHELHRKLYPKAKST